MFKKQQGILLVAASLFLLSVMGGYIYYVFYYDNPQVIDVNEVDSPITPVVKNEENKEPVVTTTTTTKDEPKVNEIQSTQKEVFTRPLKTGDVVKPYFNEKGEVQDITKAITKFDNVYYPNNGVNYANNGNSFEVVAVSSGNVSDVYDDEVYGKCVVINSNGYEITYQSLKDTTLKKGDTIKQGAIIGNAGSNKYDADLGINVRVIVLKNGVYLNLEDLLNKSV